MRYLPLRQEERDDMLRKIGVKSIDDLFVDLPPSMYNPQFEELPTYAGEMAVEKLMSGLAARNLAASSVPFFLGAGVYHHFVPATVDHLIQRSEFLTSYTPYQPEIAQGTLQTLFEFQTQMAMLTGMEVSNASMYDGSTACAEAVLMARRINRKSKALVLGSLHPQYAEVVKTLTTSGGETVDILPLSLDGGTLPTAEQLNDCACLVVQYPAFSGQVTDLVSIRELCNAAGALMIVVVNELLALSALQSPGSLGADIVCGDAQSFGNSLNFGGPSVGILTTREKFVRQMPGRVCGETVDANGARGFVLTLSTREQHIRRAKATSNICTNAGLGTLACSIHLSLLGERGLRQLAAINHAAASKLSEMLSGITGVEVLNNTFFNEFTVRLKGLNAEAVVENLAAKSILAGVPYSRLCQDRDDLSDCLLIACTEMTSDEDMQELCMALKEMTSC